MALSLVLAVVLGVVLWGVASRLSMGDGNAPRLLVAGYVTRLIAFPLFQQLSFFSYSGGGGDAAFYEDGAWLVARVWFARGLHYVTSAELPFLNHATLQCNVYALVIAANGGDRATYGCAAVGAFVAAVAFLMIYRLARFLGAEAWQALWVTGLLYFSPGFIYYTTGTHKEAFVVVCTVGAVSASLRLARRLSFEQVLLGGFWLLGLWRVRYYLVFVAMLPLVVSFIVSRVHIAVRVLAVLALAVAVAIVSTATTVTADLSERATKAYDIGTSSGSRDWNALGGSGVHFDDGGKTWGAFGPKLAYTLFSPFPWTGGSLGLQLGKVDTILWYYLAYLAVKAGRRLWGTDRVLLFSLLAFLVPLTVLYATTMANIGLIFRQRFPVVLLTACLSAQALGSKRRAGEGGLSFDRLPTRS